MESHKQYSWRKKQSTRPSLKVYNQLSSNLVEISDHFNYHFVSVASKFVEDLPKLSTAQTTARVSISNIQNFLYAFPTSPQEIKKIISEIKPKKRCCLDGIPIFLLHKLSANIYLVLSHVFNLSISQGGF